MCDVSRVGRRWRAATFWDRGWQVQPLSFITHCCDQSHSVPTTILAMDGPGADFVSRHSNPSKLLVVFL
jgi:hypothetical protein